MRCTEHSYVDGDFPAPLISERVGSPNALVKHYRGKGLSQITDEKGDSNYKLCRKSPAKATSYKCLLEKVYTSAHQSNDESIH